MEVTPVSRSSVSTQLYIIIHRSGHRTNPCPKSFAMISIHLTRYFRPDNFVRNWSTSLHLAKFTSCIITGHHLSSSRAALAMLAIRQTASAVELLWNLNLFLEKLLSFSAMVCQYYWQGISTCRTKVHPKVSLAWKLVLVSASGICSFFKTCGKYLGVHIWRYFNLKSFVGALFSTQLLGPPFLPLGLVSDRFLSRWPPNVRYTLLGYYTHWNGRVPCPL